MSIKAEDLAKLREPFPADDVEWRVSESGDKAGKPWALCVAYITNRAIMDRLDEVCGPANWRNEYTAGPGGGVICALSIKVDGEWITKSDGADNTHIEQVKGGLSGAMKRAAVQWGIGRYLYDIETAFANIDPNGVNRGKTKSGVYFKWNPPKMPAWAVPAGSKPQKTKPEATPEPEDAPQAPPTPPGGDVAPYARAMSVIRNAMTEADLARFGRMVDQRAQEGVLTPDEVKQLEAAVEARRQDLRGKTLDRETLTRHCKRLGCPAEQYDQWIDKAQVSKDAIKFLESKPWNSDDGTEAIVAELKAATSEFTVDEIYDRACGPESTLSAVAQSVITAERKAAKERLAAAPKANGKRKQSQLLETGPNTGA